MTLLAVRMRPANGRNPDTQLTFWYGTLTLTLMGVLEHVVYDRLALTTVKCYGFKG